MAVKAVPEGYHSITPYLICSGAAAALDYYRKNGVETWYVLFADEGHGFLKKHNNDLRREVETVFLQRLFAAR